MTARVVAGVLSAWAGWRWLTVLVGMSRVRRFRGPARREARRSVVVRAAWTTFVSVGALYAWTAVLRIAPKPDFVGLLAAVLVCSLAVAAAAAFMQPAERTPETLEIFRLRTPRRADDAGGRGEVEDRRREPEGT